MSSIFDVGSLKVIRDSQISWLLRPAQEYIDSCTPVQLEGSQKQQRLAYHIRTNMVHTFYRFWCDLIRYLYVYSSYECCPYDEKAVALIAEYLLDYFKISVDKLYKESSAKWFIRHNKTNDRTIALVLMKEYGAGLNLPYFTSFLFRAFIGLKVI